MRIKNEEQTASRRALIMRAAREIMETQGMGALSIRKVAATIQQTSGIIYHYFPGKEELMFTVIQEGYQHILCTIQQTMASEKSPAAQLRAMLFGYVRGTLEDPLLYQVVMQNKLPSVQEQTAILQENLRQYRKSTAMLCICLEEGIACGEFSVEQVEFRAQGIWRCVYGLSERILIEQPVFVYRNKVIEEVLDLIMVSLRPHEIAQEAEQSETQVYDRDSITIYEAARRKQGNGEQMNTLIIYKSKHDIGKEVVVYLQQKLCADLQEADPVLSWEGYERIIRVGSIYAGKLVKQLLACIYANTKELAGKSVSMLLYGMSNAAPEKTVTENLGETCYRQLAFTANIDDRLDFQKLGFLERKIICTVNKQGHLYEDKGAVPVDRLHWDTIDSVTAGQTHEAQAHQGSGSTDSF